MKGYWCLLLASATWLGAESAPLIDIAAPTPIPVETTAQIAVPSALPISNTERDLADPLYRFYDNRIVKVRMRVRAAWTVMEFKEAENSGTVSFTLSRQPLVTFAVVRAPLEGPFDAYVDPSALASLYPKTHKRTAVSLSGRKGVLIEGILEDGRKDQSHFSTDGQSFYRVSFSAPTADWAEAEKQFRDLEKSFQWLK